MSTDTPMIHISGKCIKGKHWQCHPIHSNNGCECDCHKVPVKAT